MEVTQEQLKWALEIARCKSDFDYLCKTYLHIKSKTVIGFPTLKLNRVQRYLWDKMYAQWKREGYIRQCWGKSRQIGSSTLVHAMNFWRTNFFDYHNSFIISYDEPTAYEQFDKIKTFYDALPDALKSVTKYWAKGKIDFEDRRSRILCGHARNVNVGAGDMNHFLHMTEAARYPNADQVQTSIFPTVSEARGDQPSIVVIESTSFFGGDWYKNFSEDAMAGRNGFEFHFIPYYFHDWFGPGQTAKLLTASMAERHAEGLVCMSGCARDGALAGAFTRAGGRPRPVQAREAMALGRRLVVGVEDMPDAA